MYTNVHCGQLLVKTKIKYAMREICEVLDFCLGPLKLTFSFKQSHDWCLLVIPMAGGPCPEGANYRSVRVSMDAAPS